MRGAVQSYRDLDVYQKALDLQQEIFELTKRFPVEERYSLTDQIRRSSRSIGANISEAWAKRRYPLHFVSKLSDSAEECNETEHWLRSGFLCMYYDQARFDELLDQCTHIGAMLNRMMDNADAWCHNCIPHG